MIYLDNASTTKVDLEVAKVMEKYFVEEFYNPSAIYYLSSNLKEKIDLAKQQVLNNFKIDYNNNLIFTGSATEANNLAILGSIKSNFKKILFSMGEHPSVYNVAKNLKEKGYNVVFLNLDKSGKVDINEFIKEVSTKDVSFISIMHVSNETGAINNINKLAEIAKEYNPNCIFHSDGVQAYGKINVSLNNIDLYTISAHKIHGPKGIGALYIKDYKKLKPIINGGGQELNIRSGTENVPAIMGFSYLSKNINIKENFKLVQSLKDYMVMKLSNIEGITLNTTESNSPYIISISFDKIRGETLVHKLEEQDIFISTGSACSSKKLGENRILENMGIDKQKIIGSIRVSLCKNTTLDEIKIFCDKVIDAYINLKETLGV